MTTQYDTTGYSEAAPSAYEMFESLDDSTNSRLPLAPAAIHEETLRDARKQSKRLKRQLKAVQQQLEESEQRRANVETQYKATKNLYGTRSRRHTLRAGRRRRVQSVSATVSRGIVPLPLNSNLPPQRAAVNTVYIPPPPAEQPMINGNEANVENVHYHPDYIRSGITSKHVPPPPPAAYSDEEGPPLPQNFGAPLHFNRTATPKPQVMTDRVCLTYPQENPRNLELGARMSVPPDVAAARQRRYTLDQPFMDDSYDSASSASSVGPITFRPSKEADKIKRCLKGWKYSLRPVIDTIVNRTDAELMDICNAFQRNYKQSMEKYIRGKTTSYLQILVPGMCLTQPVMSANYFHKCLNAKPTNYRGIIDVLTQSGNVELQCIKQAYNEKYADGKGASQMKRDIKKKLSGPFQRIVIRCLNCTRVEGVNNAKIDDDCKAIFKAANIETNIKALVDLFSSRSVKHLKAVNKRYKKWYFKDLQSVVREAMKAKPAVKYGLLSLLQNRMDYFVRRCHKVSNAEVLVHALLKFNAEQRQVLDHVHKQVFGKTLYSMIEATTSGDYRYGLQKLFGYESGIRRPSVSM